MLFPEDLPVPHEAARERCKVLAERLTQHILKKGPMSFEQYMETVLYAPELGYYSTGDAIFGKGGDFVTAPELSPVFAQCLAQAVASVLAQCSQGVVLELGAGSGVLAVDLLQALDGLGVLPEQYWILEPSAALQAQQKERLLEGLPKALFDRVVWLSSLPKTSCEGVVLANEVLDAMPAARVRQEAGEWQESFVAHDETQGFIETWQTARPLLAKQLASVTLKPQQIAEHHVWFQPWFASLSESVHKGVCFCIDYGHAAREYYHPDFMDGRLRCYYQHRMHDNPFVLPGLQDITTSVNFSAAALAGIASGWELAGYTTQAYFLMNCGFESVLNVYAKTEHAKIREQSKALVLPTQMGEVFKVMALSKGLNAAAPGFQMGCQKRFL